MAEGQILEGWGFELTASYSSNWARRYFTLQGSVFLCCTKPGDEASHHQNLSTCKVQKFPDTDIVSIAAPGHCALVRFETDPGRWLTALESAAGQKETRAPSNLSGALKKKGQRGLGGGGWKKRWFVFSNGFLKYYPTASDTGQVPLGIVDVTGSKLEFGSDPLQLTINELHGRRLNLQADTPATLEQWVSIFKPYCATEEAGIQHLKTGWLTKRGRVITSWKKRFFVLDIGILRYFKSDREDDMVLPQGIVSLTEAVVEPKEGGFTLTTPGRVLLVKCEAAEVAPWVQVLRECIRGNELLVPVAEEPREFKGWLVKRGRKVQSWQKRWCVCNRGCLSYFESEDESIAPKGAVMLKACAVAKVPGDQFGRENCLEVSSYGRKLVLQADSDATASKWLEVINEHSTGRGKVQMKKAGVIQGFSDPPADAAATPQLTSPLSPEPGTPQPVDTPASPMEQYSLMHVIGRGGFGKVFLVRDRQDRSGSFLAMKTLQKARLVAAKQVKYVAQERDIMAAVSLQRHPFILSLLRAFQTPQKLYMILEFATGGELRHRMFRFGGKFPADIVRFVSAELFLAIEYLHSVKVVHRDLKTENVLLDSQGHIKLCDFGLARRQLESGRFMSFVGTPEYLAPEIVTGAGHGKEADWWAFGILVFECLVGETPFVGTTPEGTYQRIMHGNPHMPTLVPSQARPLLLGLLHPDPSSRTEPAAVRANAFYKGLNWEKLAQRKIKSPLRQPDSQKKMGFMNNFDPSYVALEKARDSLCREPPAGDPQLAALADFDWAPPPAAS